MERRINKKIEEHHTSFIEKIKTIISINNSENQLEKINEIINAATPCIIGKLDFVKRKRVKNIVDLADRCCACRANGEQCTRRRKDSSQFCGTHIKGTPHGEVSTEDSKPDTTTTVQVWAQDIKGIIYFIDKDGNVYDPQQVHQNLKNPLIIAKYTKTEDGEYDIPSIF